MSKLQRKDVGCSIDRNILYFRVFYADENHDLAIARSCSSRHLFSCVGDFGILSSYVLMNSINVHN